MLVESEQLKQPSSTKPSQEQIVRSVIAEIRPDLQRHGGDCELVEIDGSKIMVRLSGACVFCKLSSGTLEGIQARLVEKLGEFFRVLPVAGAAKTRN
ncbi:NifU family protein [Bradyrhizobium sp. Tv2a-2]|uniref:NifU family protein n=1 Tax=Bradyrhizobium sp. Tv2a-2 TaxID=113395 RepID=UPI00040ABACF|nr:NifU family protein [Bradyrhizobium sp. Tv2a-2]